MIKKIGILTNLEKDAGLANTRRILDWIIGHGCIPLIEHDLASAFNISPSNALYQESELIIVLGGDGTMLRASRLSAPYGKPLLGVNLGNLGYLTTVEPHEAINALDAVLAEAYTLERRMMLQLENWHALNDVCIKSSNFKLIRIQLFINNEYIDTFRADGIIISTPTGSTAYNLSAGGPILKPDSEMIAVTAICPHALYMRPWVISADDVVGIRVPGESVSCSMDGESVNLDTQLFTVKRSVYTAKIIKTKDLGFYEILRRKMIQIPGDFNEGQETPSKNN
jgi:NAD+ kinase